MELNNLTNTPGARKSSKRVGRGCGSGLGKTSGKGQKGQQSRKGHKHKLQFEGGQMPLQRRLPKFGFKNINRKEYQAVNLSSLQALAEAQSLTKIGLAELVAAGLASSKQLVKILGVGELKAQLTVEAHAFSKSAEAAIVAAGGTATKL